MLRQKPSLELQHLEVGPVQATEGMLRPSEEFFDLGRALGRMLARQEFIAELEGEEGGR